MGRQVRPENVCNFEIESWRAEQGARDQMHLGVSGCVRPRGETSNVLR